MASSFVARFPFSPGRRGSPFGCDSSDAHEFVGIEDPAVCGDPAVCDLDRVDGVDPAFPAEHEGELAADLGEVDAVRVPLAPRTHHDLDDALAAVDELACRGDLAAAVGDIDGVRVQEPDQAGQVSGLVGGAEDGEEAFARGDGALAVAITTTFAQASTAKVAPRPRRRPSRGPLTRLITLPFMAP